MIDALFQQLSTVQSNLQPTPKTIAAAATITPDTFLTLVTGTTALATITPPVAGTHMLALSFTATNPSAFTTTGNILTASTPATNGAITFMIYNPITGKYRVAVTSQ
jgi:hypothetical protein